MHRTFGFTLCLALASLLIACGDDNAKAPTNAPTSAATAAPIEATRTAAPTSQPTAPPALSPTASAADAPRVLWILRDHAGTGVDTVRFETTVETTAVVSVFGSPGAPGAPPPAQSDTAFAKTHSVGQPLGTAPGAIHVEVTDRQGRKGSADLEMGAVLGRQFFGATPAVAPKITFDGNRGATVTWVNLKGPAMQNSVQVFAKKGGCSTAQACQASLEKAFTQDAGGPGDPSFESHKVAIQFGPDKTQDYQVLITALLVPAKDATQSTALFYQFNVVATDVK